jgi:hypothetical protein|tara:strand:+ start:245 stop:457 length:213 start_codon:yes stop_codon:yes gene_type:complete
MLEKLQELERKRRKIWKELDLVDDEINNLSEQIKIEENSEGLKRRFEEYNKDNPNFIYHQKRKKIMKEKK